MIVEEVSQAEVRFANNTTTTNGVRRDRRVAVVSFQAVGSDGSAGFARHGGGRGQRERRGRGHRAGPGQRGRGGRVPPRPTTPPPGRARRDSPHGRDFDEPPVPPPRPCSAGSSRGWVTPSPGPGRPATGWRGSPPTASRPSTSARAPDSGSATSSPPAPWSSWPAAPTAPARCGRARAPRPSTTSTSTPSRPASTAAWPGPDARVELPAGRYEVLLPPDAAADLMVAMSQAMSGRDAEEGRSPFSAPGGGTRIGEQLCPLPFELRGDPARARPRVGPVPGDGRLGDRRVGVRQRAPGRPHRLDRRGPAAPPPVPPRRGRALGCSSPSPPVGNLVLALPGATASLDDMIAGTDRGLLLTCLWYIREVDPVTLLLTGPHPRRRLPRRARRGRGGGEQLPFQREPPRRPGPRHRGRGHRAGPVTGMGRVDEPHRHAPARGWRTST